MADERISAVLEQLRRIIAEASFRHLEYEIDLLVCGLEAFQSMILDHGDGLFSVQLLERGITVHALDQVLYDIEDVISGVFHFGVSIKLAALGLEEVETKSTAAGLEKFASTKSKAACRKKFGPKSAVRASEEKTTLVILHRRLKELMEVLIGIPQGSHPSHSKRSFFVKLSKLYGLDVVKKDIINAILGESFRDRSDNIKTIFIVGMEGTGKTYLARCICTDCQVLEIFDNIIWVNVSDDFDLDKIARKIIQSLEGLEHDSASPNITSIAKSVR